MKSFNLVAFLFLNFSISINGLKILGVLPFPSKSHWFIGHEIIKALVDAGHEATVLAPYPLKEPIRNYEEIDISKILKVFEEDEKLDPFMIRKLPYIMGVPFLHFIGNKLTGVVMENEEVQKFMKREEKFDVCFLESFHANALTGIFDRFDCAFISYSSSTVSQWVDVLTSNISPPSYVSSAILPYAGKLNFYERFWNTLYENIESFLYYIYKLPTQRGLYNRYFPNAKKSMDEMINSPALVFLCNHVSANGARPYLPNMIEIGGIHITPKKPLPKDIQEYLDYAPDGVILFSMGSIVKAKNFPTQNREAFVRAFGKIKQKILWKYENETLPDKPDNVMISSWLPQRDILAHPNVKLFISHGGYLGITEATSEGVPILGMAMYGDQGRNIANIVYQERGLGLNIDDITEENVLNLINELLHNPKYKQNAELVAKRFNDRVMTPQQQVVYWTEYVARHQGAPFLRSAGSDLNAIEFYSIDVYFVIFAIILLIIYIEYRILKYLFTKIKRKFSGKQKKN